MDDDDDDDGDDDDDDDDGDGDGDDDDDDDDADDYDDALFLLFSFFTCSITAQTVRFHQRSFYTVETQASVHDCHDTPLLL